MMKAVMMMMMVVVAMAAKPAGAQQQQQEMEALLKLKESLQSPESLSSWRRSNSSNSNNGSSIAGDGEHCKGWKGVRCSSSNGSSSTVVELWLPGLHLGARAGANASIGAVGELPHLESLNLSNNELRGALPPELFGLRSLKLLDLSRNRFAGELPGAAQAWANLSRLAILRLHYNALSGAIPRNLALAVGLESVVLKNNSLSGGIPAGIFGIPGLWQFVADFNALTGPVPAAAAALRYFSAAHNALDGSLPGDAFSNASGLEQLLLGHNRLTGGVPASLADPPGLRVLDLSYNQLSGAVPPGLVDRFGAASFAGNPALCGGDGRPCAPASPAPRPGVKPPPPAPASPHDDKQQRTKRRQATTAAIVGGAIGGAIALALLLLALRLRRRQRLSARHDPLPNWFASPAPSFDLAKRSRFSAYRRSFNRYAYDDIVAHAGHFDTAHVVGKGRLATVYRAGLPDGSSMAVKVFRRASSVPASFDLHLDSLALLRHRNLLCIKAVFSSPVEKAILFDYMPMGTLEEHLHGPAAPQHHHHQKQQTQKAQYLLDWHARHGIALGVAQALVYLHGNRVVHRDLKPTNILLDDAFVPKVSDFGLLHVISIPADDHGGGGENLGVRARDAPYVAPEIAALPLNASKRKMLRSYTEKSDVYSYGAVLLELLTGQRATPRAKADAALMHGQRRGHNLMDLYALQSCLWPENMDKALGLAICCLADAPDSRPSMSEVVSALDGLCPVPSPLKKPSFS